MHIQHIRLHTSTSDLCAYYVCCFDSSVSEMISITVIGVYFDTISLIGTFVFIPIFDRTDWICHMFTPVIGKDLGLHASEYSYTLEVCYYHLYNILLRTMVINLIHYNCHCT